MTSQPEKVLLLGTQTPTIFVCIISCNRLQKAEKTLCEANFNMQPKKQIKQKIKNQLKSNLHNPLPL